MKKILTIIILFIGVLKTFASPPNLVVEKLFDGRYNRNPNVETTIFINNGIYYRGFTIKGDAKVISEIRAAMDKDLERSIQYTFHTDTEGSYISMQFINNEEKINSGLQIESPGNGFFYIQAKETAFK